jgi:hypothetical protein
MSDEVNVNPSQEVSAAEPVAAAEVQPTILGEVVATGTAVASKITNLGAFIERAMVEAINACYAAGTTGEQEILDAKMKAFEKAKQTFEDMANAIDPSVPTPD